MKLVYEANACSIENLIISSCCNSSKTFVLGSPAASTSSSSSSSTSDVDETQANVSIIYNVNFQIVRYTISNNTPYVIEHTKCLSNFSLSTKLYAILFNPFYRQLPTQMFIIKG